MIDILYNKLGSLNDLSLAEWNDVEPAIFNRHAQYSHATLPEVQEPLVVPEVKEVPVLTKKNESVKDTKSTKSTKSTTIKPLDIIAD